MGRLTALMVDGRKVTVEQLVDELDCAERDLNDWRAEANERARRIDLALKLIDRMANTIHLDHNGPLETCLRGECVVVRKDRKQVAL